MCRNPVYKLLGMLCILSIVVFVQKSAYSLTNEKTQQVEEMPNRVATYDLLNFVLNNFQITPLTFSSQAKKFQLETTNYVVLLFKENAVNTFLEFSAYFCNRQVAETFLQKGYYAVEIQYKVSNAFNPGIFKSLLRTPLGVYGVSIKHLLDLNHLAVRDTGEQITPSLKYLVVNCIIEFFIDKKYVDKFNTNYVKTNIITTTPFLIVPSD